MWQRFTERARRVILLAQEEAGKMGSDHIGTEHLLLGLLSEDEGVASQALQKMGVSLEAVRNKIRDQNVDAPSSGDEPKLTSAAKHVLELAAHEARKMRHNYIGTEHLLLALLREPSGAANVLGVDMEEVRVAIWEHLGTDASTREEVSGRESQAPRRGAGLFGRNHALLEKIADLTKENRSLQNEVAIKEKENLMLRERIAMLREKIETASTRESKPQDDEVRALRDEIASLKFDVRALYEKIAESEENRAPDENA